MDNVLTPVRDLTDSDQNQAVLDVASVLVEGGLAPERLADGYGPAVLAEAAAVARSRRRLAELAGPIHLTVVWAMYGETGRMVPRAEHPHGEDFVRTKVRQLDWLTGGLPGVTWSIIACDDGCSDQPSSADLMTEIAAAEGYPKEGNRSVTVLRLAEVIANGPSISPAFDRLTSTDQSRKGGSILAGLAAAVGSGRRRQPAPAGTWSATPTRTCRRTWPSSARWRRRSWAATRWSPRSASVTGSTGRC